ncbi:magnesium/cobalt transporter CorA [Arthrobacter echini]|uniref:Magnesium transport protein CorA n=1 Tax=Arthrobacter echini TaxID=1529066 RepID=A0A5D0XSW1_9MICC|nr:magnesium/cobalt transporter CorA [Arthrobacter echini]TYC98902.1 magnesium/cobalt transporter CorA [Arthrobacter echini]
MPLITNAVYVDGKKRIAPQDLDRTFELMRESGGMAWIGLYRPDREEIAAVEAEFGLHPLAVEDATNGHQRAKLERYGDTLFVVLRPARYLDAEEKVEFGELHLFIGQDFVVTIRHAESPDLGVVRSRLEADPELLAAGPQAVLYALLDQVVDEYKPVVQGLENDVDEIENDLFGGAPDVSRRIYQLHREVIEFQRATQPLQDMLDGLLSGARKYRMDDELARNLRDVQDHVIRVVERINTFRTLLQNALTVHSTLVAQRQNEEMTRLTETSLTQGEQVKRISSWAAILFAPTLIASIYGMNFDLMPELHWQLGYPFAIVLMIALGGGLYWAFRRNRWL